MGSERWLACPRSSGGCGAAAWLTTPNATRNWPWCPPAERHGRRWRTGRAQRRSARSGGSAGPPPTCPSRTGPSASLRTPIRYLLFDLLVYRDRSLHGESLTQRRAVLAELVQQVQEPLLVFSEGLSGAGQDFFERVVALGHEGIMAKQLSSRYQAGKRETLLGVRLGRSAAGTPARTSAESAWRKIKPVQALACVIVGYTRARDGLDSLLVATLSEGILRYAGQVRRGLTKPVQADLVGRLAQRRRSQPVVSCSQPALWVEPELCPPGALLRLGFRRPSPLSHLPQTAERRAGQRSLIRSAGSALPNPSPHVPCR
jgi:hypothetical protein